VWDQSPSFSTPPPTPANWKRRWTFVNEAEYELLRLNVKLTGDIGGRKQAVNIFNGQELAGKNSGSMDRD
jgi:hypothetical protein